MHILVYSEFRDSFLPHANLASKDSLILCTFTPKLIDSTIDSGIHAYPITLGHKNKDNILMETTYIKEINKLEDLNVGLKVYSKKHG